MTYDIQIYGIRHIAKLPFAVEELRSILASMLTWSFSIKPDARPFSTELILVRDGEMISANASQMGCQGPTNILSFPAAPSSGIRAVCACGGDSASLLLNVDAAIREALLFGESVRYRILSLLSHGIGHLMGFEHGRKMFEFSDNILKYHIEN